MVDEMSFPNLKAVAMSNVGALPEEMEEMILARMPRRDAIKMQLVCQDWNRMVCSMLHCGTGFKPDLHYPVVFSSSRADNCFGFNREHKQWRKLPALPLAGDQEGFSRSRGRSSFDVNKPVHPDSFMGLLCWTSSAGDDVKVFVCKPGEDSTVTCLPDIGFRASLKPRVLACAKIDSTVLFGGCDDGGCGYRVLAMISNEVMVSGADAGPASVFMYGSRRNTWNRLRDNICMQELEQEQVQGSYKPRRLVIKTNSPGVLVGHSVFALAALAQEYQPSNLVEYDTQLEVWRNRCGVDWEGYKQPCRCGDRFILVTVDGNSNMILIHTLDGDAGRMKLYIRMPLAEVGFDMRNSEETFFSNEWAISAAGNEVFIIRLDRGRFLQVASYNVVKHDGLWSGLPACPFQSTKVGRNTDFQPLPSAFALL